MTTTTASPRGRTAPETPLREERKGREGDAPRADSGLSPPAAAQAGSEGAAGAGTADAPRRPRLAIMGEFSAGKSTLCNLLLGTAPLPVRVTATQLPPVWLSHGRDAPWRETRDGEQLPLDPARLEEVSLEETALIRMFLDADILHLCDLIDMPGISDPNMSPEVWQGVLEKADAVLWCTHATQAWRQSEAAVWAEVPERVRARSLLLITRCDKLLSERDRARVLQRVRHEAGALFEEIFPISLTRAIEAEYDRQQWIASGAEAFSQHLLDLLQRLAAGEAAAERSTAPETPRVRPIRVRPARIRPATARPPRPSGPPAGCPPAALNPA